MEQIHRGYFDLIETGCSGLKPMLDPWSRGDRLEDERGERPVVAGELSGGSLSYYFGFAPAGEPVAILERDALNAERPRYAPENGVVHHIINLGLSEQKEDSGRLIAANVLLGSLKELVKERALPPVGWIARERLRSHMLAVSYSGVLPKKWRSWSVARVRAWAEETLAKHRARLGGVVDFVYKGRFGEEDVHLSDVSAIAVILQGEGLGEMTIEELGLPGPDKKIVSGPFANGYSRDRKLARMAALYKAVADTYRAFCQTFLAGFAKHFFYAQFPCRAVVDIELGGPKELAGVRLMWEVVERWDLDPVVRIADGRQSWKELEMLAGQTRAACERLGRKFIDFIACSMAATDLWPSWNAVVTSEVCDLLESDIERLERRLSGKD
jgi:hypothetical protein